MLADFRTYRKEAGAADPRQLDALRCPNGGEAAEF
jgi:hypothetical protein